MLIYLILLFQFHRHRKALLIMLTMPLSVFGAIVGLYLTGFPFGFTSFVGIISLMGLVVRSGIILVGYAEDLQREKGLDGRAAALAAGKRRMRPVFLTSAAAAIGVVPMILSGSTLWGSLGTVTCFGLLFSMLLTLFVLPVAYWKVAATPGGYPGVRVPGGATPILLGLLVLAAAPAAAQEAIAPEAPLTLEQAAFTKYFPQVSATAAGLQSGSPLAEVTTQGGNLPVFNGGVRTGLTAYLPAGTWRWPSTAAWPRSRPCSRCTRAAGS